MFTSKKDVDKHVRTGFTKLLTENEKSMRGYSVAKLYARIGEYHSALHYVSTYLAIKDDSAQAHRLAGQCHERLKRLDKAIASYQRSLQLDPKQSDLLIDVCKLLLSATATNDDGSSGAVSSLLTKPGTLRYYCDLADAQRVQHEAVVSLKMRLLRRDTFTPQQVDEMLQREIAAQPHSVQLRIQLVRHMLEQRRLDEAFKYVNELEQRQQQHSAVLEQFAHSLDWYSSVAQVLTQLDQRDVTHSWPYWLLAVTTAERQLFLTLCAADRRSYAPAAQLLECAGLLHHFDQTLDRAAQAVPAQAATAELGTAFVAHFRGQLCLHAATVVYRKEQLQKTHWREVQKVALPLLLCALNAGGNDPKGSGVGDSGSEQVKQLLRHWHREAAFRCCQAGRTLLAHVDETKLQCSVMANIRKIGAADKTGLCTSQDELLAQIRQYCSDADWRRSAFRALYAGLGSKQLDQHATSYLVHAPALAEPHYKLCDPDELHVFAETAQWLQPASLALHVYLAVGGAQVQVPDTLADYRCAVFDGLNVTVANLVNCGTETLSQLDVDAVLLASAVQTQQRLVEERRAAVVNERAGSTPSSGASVSGAVAANLVAVQRPFANVVAQLATEEQAAWWLAAYRVYKNVSTPDIDLAEVRATIQHGLEAVRGVGTAKMDLMICLRLGQIFASRATSAAKPSERQPLDARADALFKFALHIIRMRANGTLGSAEQLRSMFRFPAPTGQSAFESECTVNVVAEEAVTYVASRYFKSQAYQECIDELAGIQLPFATYFVAEAYRKLEQTAGATTPRKNRRVYVEKARDALQQTLELLDYPHVDKSHALRAIVHDDMRAVQQQLTRTASAAVSSAVDLSCTNGSGCGGGIDEYLNDSAQSVGGGRTRRQVAAADLSTPRVDELKTLMMKMMEQMTLVQDDMMAVRTRLGNIEEQLNRKPEPAAAATTTTAAATPSQSAGNPLEDYYLEDELNQQQAYAYGAAAFSTPRGHGLSGPLATGPPHSMLNAGMHGFGGPPPPQSQAPYFGNMYQQQQQQQHQLLASGGFPTQPPMHGRSAILTPQQQQQQQPFMDPMYAAMSASSQNSNILGLLQPPPMQFAPHHQQQQPPPPFGQLPPTSYLQQPPPSIGSTPQHQQYAQPPLVMPNQLPPSNPSQLPAPQPQPQPPLSTKPWNPVLNNAPVEKAPPVNVVITSSDPLPLLGANATTSAVSSAAVQPTFSVTIPPQHIKSNPSQAETAALKSAAYVPPFVNTTPTNSVPMYGGLEHTPASLAKTPKSVGESTGTPIVVTPKPAANAATEANKSKAGPFGALNFSTPKGEKIVPKVQADRDAAAKPSPFANFTFGKSAVAPSSTVSTFGSISAGTSTTTLFGSLSASKAAAVGKVEATTAAPETTTTTSFPGSGLFSGLTATKSLASAPKLSTSLNKSTDASPAAALNDTATACPAGPVDVEDDYVPTAQFEPVIALPDLVDTKTGEEEEHIRFEHRAKLLRFVKDTKEWKERGIGQMKVLVNKQDASKVRLLMRREQVLKLCCNQMIAKDTKFNALGTAGTSMTWFGQDFSENELQVELFAIRFKTADTCKQFHEAVLEAQRNIAVERSTVTSAEQKDKAVESATKTSGFGDKFKSASGSWDCTGCYVTNKPGTLKCLACNGPAPGGAAPLTAAQSGFGDKFKSASGSWDCTGCYVTNKPGTVKCVACNGPAPVAADPAASATQSPPAVATDSGFGNLFKPKTGSWECKACYISNNAVSLHCVACNTSKDETVPAKPKTHSLLATSANAPKFSFGVPMAAAPVASETVCAPAPTSAAPGAFSFGSFTATMSSSNANSTVFGAASSAANNTTATAAPTSTFGFALNGPATKTAPSTSSASESKITPTLPIDIQLQPKDTFSFVFKPKSPTQKSAAKSPLKNYLAGAEDVSDDEANLEEENNTYFTPVIALPDKVEVVTGEENETVLYAHRARLYRYADGEWKERGLGEVKILRHCQTAKLRVVMRREQVHKICLNHALNEDIVYGVKDEKSWHFVANDYSEGAVEFSQFCLRFKNPDIAGAFKSAALAAISGQLTTGVDGEAGGDNGATATGSQAGDTASNVSDEDKRLAEQMRLPLAFFGYRNAPSCPGCRGCRSDDFEFPDFSTAQLEHLDSEPLPLTMPARKQQIQPFAATNVTSSSTASMAKQNSFTFATPSPAGGNLFGGQSTFGSTQVAKPIASVFGDAKPATTGLFGSAASTFFGTDSASPTPATLTGGNIFGGISAATPASQETPKPLPTKSFAFGGPSPFAGTGSSPFQVSNVAATTTPATTLSTATSSSSFVFSLPSSTTTVTAAADSTAKSFSFASALGAATTAATSSAAVAPTTIFGGAAVFKVADIKDGSEKTNIFANRNNNGSTLNVAADTSETVAPDATSVFGSLGSGSTVFGGFGQLAAAAKTNSIAPTDAVPFKDTGFSFASFASAATSGNLTADSASNDVPAGGFIGLSNKDKFTSFQKPPTSGENGNTVGASGGAVGGEEAGGEDPNYDPHYDPIIALPDEIEVKTGEEDEQKVFGERAKLFRYDTTNREWKERGIGELKILHHVAKDTYRILLRREQIFKLVLNHALTPDVSITPMQSSDKAFCWATINYAEDPAGVAEQLSVRFKNSEIGGWFLQAVEKSMKQLLLRPQAD